MMAELFQFIAGTDDFLVDRAGNERWAPLAASVDDDLCRDIVDGQAGTIAEVESAVAAFISAIQTMPMFGDRKVVWLRNMNFLADNVMGRSDNTALALEKLQAALERINPADVSVLITAIPVDRRKKAYKWFQKHGKAEFLEAKEDPAALAGILRQEAEKYGCTLAPGATEALIARTHGSTRLVIGEISKMAAYLGADGGEITESLILELVPPFGEGDFFETVEAFYALDLPWTLKAIRLHFFQGGDARPLIYSLQNRNRLLIQMKALADAGVFRGAPRKGDLERAAGRFGREFEGLQEKSAFNIFTQHPFYLSRLGAKLDRLRLKDLIEFQHAFLEAFAGILQRPTEQEAVMRETAIRCLA